MPTSHMDAKDILAQAGHLGRMNMRVFRDLFGMHPESIANIAHEILDNASKVRDLLMTLHYLKCYPLVHVGSLQWGLHHRTYMNRILEMLHLIDGNLTIELSDRKYHPPLSNRGLFAGIHLIVDGTVCPINRPSNTEDMLYHLSGKHKSVCIKYEVGVNVVTGEIVWVGGPIGGSVHDMLLLRMGGLLDRMEPGEKMLADKGYVGEDESDKILTPTKRDRGMEERDLPVEVQLRNRKIQNVRVLVEHSIGRIKRFSILRDRFRNVLEMHGMVFRVCCKLTNLDLVYFPLRNAPHAHLI